MGIFLLLALSFLFPAILHGQTVEHVVQPGETVYGIARRYGVPVDQILGQNNLDDPRMLRAGQRLRISEHKPPVTTADERVVEIQPGDTLFSLARRYQVSVETLRQRNGLDHTSRIRIGQKLIVPNQAASISETPQRDSPRVKIVKLEIFPLENRPVPVNRPVSGLLFRSPGQEFRAVEKGRVVYRDVFSGLGNLILIESESGMIFGYAGWSSAQVSPGQRIDRGDVLGKLARDPPGSLLFFIYTSERVLTNDLYYP